MVEGKIRLNIGLARGKWEKFSLEMLITLVTRAGMHVTLKKAA